VGFLSSVIMLISLMLHTDFALHGRPPCKGEPWIQRTDWSDIWSSA